MLCMWQTWADLFNPASHMPESSSSHFRGLGAVLGQLLKAPHSCHCESEAHNWILALSDDVNLQSHVNVILLVPEISDSSVAPV